MNFFCGLVSQKGYCVQVYPIYDRSISNSSHLSEDSDSISNKNMPQEKAQLGPFITPGFSPTTNRSFPSSLRQQSKNTISTQSSIPPQQLMSEFGVLQSLQVPKDQVGIVLRQKNELAKQFDQPGGVVLRMIKKSDYEVISSLDYKDGKWKDQSFATPKIYTDRFNKQKSVLLEWVSAEEWTSKALNKKPSFMDANFVATDVMQGSLVGDCYFLSAVACLANHPERILRLFPSISLNNKGVYMSRIMHKGIFQEVVIDDRFPVSSNNHQLIGCRPCSAGNEIYVMVLQKCWAKLWHSYQAIDGGFPHEALHALTGAPTKNYLLRQETNTPQKSESFFKQLMGYFKREFVMCAGTSSRPEGRATVHHEELGVIQIKIMETHIYCVEEVFEFDSEGKRHQMVKLFNPWGYNEDQNEEILIKGEICISWEQFIKNFSYVTTCKIRDNAHYLYTELQHCQINRFTFIELNVFQAKSGYIAITLSETDKKQKDHNYLVLTFVVLKAIINPKTQRQEYQFKKMRTEAQFSDHYLELENMTQGKYIIGLYFSQVQVEEHLTFGVYSQDTFGFSQKKMNNEFEENFLYNLFQIYNKTGDSSMKVCRPVQGHDISTSFNYMVSNSVFSYFLLRVGKGEMDAYELVINRQMFTKGSLKVWEPYDIPEIRMIAKPGFETIVILTPQNYKKSDKNKPPKITPKSGNFLTNK